MKEKNGMMGLKLPRLISDGMILQQKQNCCIWGWDIPGRKIEISFLNKIYQTVVEESGTWQIVLCELLPGGPYTMKIKNDAAEEVEIHNILVGDVWFCSGQSNMELPMERVKDAFPEEIADCQNPFIRTFKIMEHADFQRPLEDVLTGEWKEAKADTIFEFSATAYFFAKAFYQMSKVPVGLINASLGGSGIECWMSRGMLDGYDELLTLADQYRNDEFVESQRMKNEEQMLIWHEKLDSKDLGIKESWEKETNWKDAETVELPFFFSDTKLKDFIGSVWFCRKFEVPEQMAGKAAHLWLGTIVDSDTAYINGVQAGHTEYQYPPRKYEVPKGVLKSGENIIVVHVKCERGMGRFTPEKTYELWNEAGKINLEGMWQYRIGAVCEASPETDFISWKPTGLYHGMTAPCHRYNIAGVLWYQGESNTNAPDSYLDLFTRMVKGYRKQWNNDQLPFFYVQLPNFSIDLCDHDEREPKSGWPQIRELQKQALAISDTGMAVTIDLGEDNDLHPLNKKDIGYRLALLAASKLYQKETEYSGPVVDNMIIECTESRSENITEENWQETKGCCIRIVCSHAEGMYAGNIGKGEVVSDMELLDDCNVYKADVEIKGEELIIRNKEVCNPKIVRYCYKNTPSGALIYNGAGLPMSPFIMKIER